LSNPTQPNQTQPIRIFELAPAAMRLFTFADDFEEDYTATELYESQQFLRHARGVVKMLDRALGMLQGPDLELLKEVLRELGDRHVEYGVLPEHYPIVGEALLSTLETALGDKLWNEKVKSGWAAVYDIVSSSMVQGANSLIEEENRICARQSKEEEEAKQPNKTQASLQAH
jgi:hypothetical protein